MRVAFVTPTLGTQGGGITTVVEALSKAVSELGIQVKVFSVETHEPGEKTLETWAGAEAEVFPPYGSARMAFSPAMTRALLAWQPDVVHMHGLWQFHGLSVRLWKQLHQKPLMISPHGMLAPWALSQSRMKKRMALLLYDAFNLKNADRIHALCPSESEAIHSAGYGTDIVEIPNGVAMTGLDEDRVRRREAALCNKSIRELVYIGRIHKKKGLRQLLEALTILENQKRLAPWRVTIAGWNQASHEEELKDVCRRNKILQRVVFVGPVFGEQKRKILEEKASAFILPSRGEALPMTVLEAWSYGLPVVMTDACNLEEGFDEGAAHQISTEPKKMATDLLAFFEFDNEQRVEMGIRGLRLSRTSYNWHNVAERFVSEYKAMVSA